MENINWICKSKTVGNNIVLMCNNINATYTQTHENLDSRFKEHFESTSNTALLGTTAFPKLVDITLGPASFGPTSDLCKDTTGFTKLGEWKLVMNNGSPAMNNDFYAGKTKGLMIYNGAKTTDWSKFPSEWQYVYQTPNLCFIDNNGFNAGAAFMDAQNYQDFNTLNYTVLYRNKNKPESYFLMPRTKVWCAGIIGMGATTYDPGYAQDRNLSRYKALGWTPEFSTRGQGGGSIIYDDVYEVFIKPFTRSSFLFKKEPKAISFSNLDSSLASKLIFWLDASDPLADGSVLADDTQVPYWFDKSSNKIRFVRTPEDYTSRLFSKIKDGEKTQDGTKLRVPRAKASIKNGLSTIRFNGRQGYRINTNDTKDPATSKFIQNTVNKNITEYTVISLQFTADYGVSNGARIFTADNYSGGFYTAIGNPAFDAPILSAWTNANNRNNGRNNKYWQSNVNVLGKWSIFTTVVSTSDLSFYVNGIKGKNNLMDWQMNQTPYETKDGTLLGLNNCCIVGVGSTDNGNATTSAFIGDLAELLFFRGALSDDDRKKVEGYLDRKWNLKDLPPESTPSITPSITPSPSLTKNSVINNYINTLNNIKQELEIIRRQTGIGPSLAPGSIKL